MRDPYDDSAKILIYVGGLVLIATMAFFSIKVVLERKESCEARGGEFHYVYRGRSLCLRKDAVLK